jgi:hypothetical protein
MCTDVCFSPETDSTIVRVEPHSSQQIVVYFYVGDEPGTGRVHLTFTNANIPTDTIKVRLVCIVNSVSNVGSDPLLSESSLLCIPNPVASSWRIHSPIDYERVRLYDMLGRLITETPAASEYSSELFRSGSYRLQLISRSGTIVGETTLIKQ